MAARFWVGGTGTWDASDTSHWSTSSGGASGASVPGASDTVTFDGSSGGGTVTVNTNPTLAATVPALTMGAFTGTLDFATNNNSISLGGLDISGTGTRTLNMGSGTWTITGVSGTVFNRTTVTNLTFNANTSTILLSATATGTRSLFLFGSSAINNLTVTNGSFNQNLIDIQSGGVTMNNVTFTNVQHVSWSASTGFTISGTLSYSGSASNQSLLRSNGAGATTLTIASASVLDWVFIQNITKAGAGSITATNSFNGGGNTNVTITPPNGGVIGG